MVLLRDVFTISCPACSAGYQCDENTGICRRFRQANADLPQLSCGNCPLGTMCDSNTGKLTIGTESQKPVDNAMNGDLWVSGSCRIFRFPGKYNDEVRTLTLQLEFNDEFGCEIEPFNAKRVFRLRLIYVQGSVVHPDICVTAIQEHVEISGKLKEYAQQ